MSHAGRGWWRVALDSAAPGDRYGFSLGGGPVRPDPRSRNQPEGVDGLSEVVDHGTFGWTDGRWRGFHLPGSVLYELHVGTFTPGGTFDAVVDRLGHLVDLGVDAIEIMPVATFAGAQGWGYDGVGLFAPHPAYGGPDGFKRLVDACHRFGLGVILDVVYNHLGPAGNHLLEFGPYLSAVHQTNWGSGVNLDGPGSDEVRRFFIDNALMWLTDYHVDGLRLDAVHALADESAVPFLEQLSAAVRSRSAHLRRPVVLIAESDRNDPRYVRPAREGGLGFDATWADEWHHAWHAIATGENQGYYSDFGSLDQLGKALRQAWVFDGEWSGHRQRTFGRAPEGLSGDHFVVCTQNHDQVGNRAAGERSGALMSRGRLMVGAGLLLTSPFVVLLFQGEEWAASTPWQYFTDFGSYPDHSLGQAVTEGRRAEFASFGWAAEDVPDPQDPATFERSKLDWSELGASRHASMLDWYRLLLRLRRAHPELTDPDPVSVSVSVTVQNDEHPGTLVVRRGSVLVVANLGPAAAAVDGLGPLGPVLAASDERIQPVAAGLLLPPDTLAVVKSAGPG